MGNGGNGGRQHPGHGEGDARPTGPRRRTWLAALLGGVAILGGLGATVAVAASGSGARTAAIQAAATAPRGARAIGTVSSTASESGEVVLRPRDNAALTQFIASVTTPRSKTFHQYLAPGAFAARFGPATGTIDAVRSSPAVRRPDGHGRLDRPPARQLQRLGGEGRVGIRDGTRALPPRQRRRGPGDDGPDTRPGQPIERGRRCRWSQRPRERPQRAGPCPRLSGGHKAQGKDGAVQPPGGIAGSVLGRDLRCSGPGRPDRRPDRQLLRSFRALRRERHWRRCPRRHLRARAV